MKKLIFLLLCILITGACGKRKKCKLADSEEGIISESFNFPPGEAGYIGDGAYLIDNDSVYKLCFPDSQSVCNIDFSKNTLLGYYSGNSCNTSYHRNVWIDQTAHTYVYELTVYECKTIYLISCVNYNWVLVPKLPPGWTVIFKKKN